MTKTAKTYGGALYDLAKEEGLCAQLLSELQLVETIFSQNPDYRKLLLEPSICAEERRQLLQQAWQGRVHPYLLNFLNLLCDRGTVGQFADCAAEFQSRYYKDAGILQVCAVCAVPLRPEQQQALQKKLQQVTKKQILLSVRVEESLLGGMRLELPDRQYDGSVQGHLERIQRMLQNTELEP